jgi:hypothetical protein
MTAAGAARGRRGKEQAQRRADAPADPTPSQAPLAPQRKLFVALLIVLAAWVALLLVMYFTTVRR